MKVIIDTKEDTMENVFETLRFIYTNNKKDTNQTKILEPNNTTDRKYYCNNPQCKKEITKDVVAFCLHEDNRPRFGGKVYCRECQQNIDIGGTD